MPHAVNSLKRPSSSYSHCPLKKRPLKYDPEEDHKEPSSVSLPEPENLSTKPEDLRVTKEKLSPLISDKYAQEIKSPLVPINLNGQSWSKVPSSSYVNFSSRSAFETFPRSVEYTSHYAPSSRVYNREPNSPPHVSPPLSHEPAYPVLRIEENQRNVNESESYYKQSYHQEYNYNYHQLSPSHSTASQDSLHSHHHHHEQETKTTQILPINVNGSVRYQCESCSKSYSTYSGLSKHMQFHCSSQNKKSFICKFCEKVYVSLGALKMHIRTHTLPCKCTLCGKAFSRPWLLQGHIRTHTGEKPFTCQHCHRAFADRSNLRAHLQTHSEVKKYSCKCCSKTFSRMSLLVKHEEGGCSTVLTNSD